MEIRRGLLDMVDAESFDRNLDRERETTGQLIQDYRLWAGYPVGSEKIEVGPRRTCQNPAIHPNAPGWSQLADGEALHLPEAVIPTGRRGANVRISDYTLWESIENRIATGYAVIQELTAL